MGPHKNKKPYTISKGRKFEKGESICVRELGLRRRADPFPLLVLPSPPNLLDRSESQDEDVGRLGALKYEHCHVTLVESHAVSPGDVFRVQDRPLDRAACTHPPLLAPQSSPDSKARLSEPTASCYTRF